MLYIFFTLIGSNLNPLIIESSTHHNSRAIDNSIGPSASSSLKKRIKYFSQITRIARLILGYVCVDEKRNLFVSNSENSNTL